MSDGTPLVRVITWLPVGGIERRLVSVLPRLREKGWAPRLVCIREFGPLAEELRGAGIPVDLVPFRSRLDRAGIRGLEEIMRRHGARVVHSHMYRSNVPATIAASRAKVPAILAQIHNIGTWESWRQRWMDRWLSRRRTGVICVSRAVQDDVCATLGLTRERAPILYNGSDTDAFRPDGGDRREARAELQIPDGRVALLVPARLHPQKNPLGVVRAFAEALRAANADAVLLFAGSGPMEEAIREEAAARGVADRVRLLGQRDDMARLYNGADAVVLSSFKEGFSNAVVEALACGKPVIAANVGGNREAVDRPAAGWIHEPGDGAALAGQLREAIAEGVAGLARREEGCRERGLRFSLAQLVEETDRLYRNALEGKALAPDP